MRRAERAASMVDVGVAAPAMVRASCVHCGLDVPSGFVEAGEVRQFCCAGCRTAYAILHEHGLEQYYAFADKREAPVRSSGRSYEEFDHPAFHALHVRVGADGLSRTDLFLEGVRCASCVWLVERTPLLLPGVARVELNVGRSLATVEWQASAVSLSRIARTLDSLGYAPHPFRGLKRDVIRRKEDRAAIMRIGVAGAIAINIMLASLALYSGGSHMEPEYERLFRWIAFALAVPAMLYPGRAFFTGAWAALRTRTLHMDLPIALGVGAGFVRGAINTVTASGPIYFDGLATLIFVLLVGRYLQLRGQRAAADSADLLYSLTPQTARVVDVSGNSCDVPVEALLPGMMLDVRSGESFAADGTVVSGNSTLNMSLLTGESRPVGVSVGATVFAGTLNISAPLRVRVEHAGESSRVARLLRHVEERATRKAPVVLFADSVSGAFIAVVISLAAAIYAYWSWRDPSQALDNAIALLIVTCPCALAMATPLAVTVAVGRAAKAGLLIRGGEVVELLAKPGRIFLDKTGTITESRTALVAWEGAEWVQPLVLALEAGSSHPVADGFRRVWADEFPTLPQVEAAEHVVGGGIIGRVAGRDVVVGSPAFVTSRAGDVSAWAGDAAFDGVTPVWIAVDGVVVARAGIGDPIRPDARAAVRQLVQAGWRVGILSGDVQPVVDAMGRTLGLPPEEVKGGLAPEDKLAEVLRARRGGSVVMVGDGVNDAAAIAEASVGVGVHGGAEACLATAGVYLTKPGLAPLVQLVSGSARTMGVIRRNMLFALAYNLVGTVLAATGTITPLIAAIMMPASSLTVIIASWRSRSFDPADGVSQSAPVAFAASSLTFEQATAS